MAGFGSAPDPFEWFRRWYEQAQQSLRGADVVALATAGAGGPPSVRFVHFKGLRANRFVFYTNYGSRKALELAANPAAALAFCWLPLRRQVRVEGRCLQLDRATSESYFSTRSRESQLSSVASEQSQELVSFDVLEARIEALRVEHAGREIPCPVNWGGIVLEAEHMEFWQGQAHRRHRRYRYDLYQSTWNLRLLYP